jgi:molybdopterin converting factor small subunit
MARAAAGVPIEEIDVSPAADLQALFADISRRHGSKMQSLLAPHESAAPPVVVFVNNEQVSWQSPPALKEGDEIMLLSPISGG